MRYTTYRYNKETCQFERVRLNARNVLWYCAGVAVTASCLLLGILLLHDVIVNTDAEKILRKENRALREHHAILSAELEELQPVLTSLENKDRVLHKRYFGSQLASARAYDHVSKEKFLLADPRTFRNQVAALTGTSDKLLSGASETNVLFANRLLLSKDRIGSLRSAPTLQPVKPWENERLISGYGMRVNPFHKGLYEHLGIDIAMPRGTPVMATASGFTREIKRSDLEAGYGNYVEIDHGNGWVTRYAHLEDIRIKYGSRISKGQVIGTLGSSGGSVAPHLHYEILFNGTNVDPVLYMLEGLTSDQHDGLTFRSHQQNQSLD
ncbi:MAG TPA: M23 family metallopeptidase, partial [Chryseosolibacter sp.]